MSRVRDWTLQYSMIWAAASEHQDIGDCICPDGWQSTGEDCIFEETKPTIQPPTFTPLQFIPKSYSEYGKFGVKIYDSGYALSGTGTFTLYNTLPFWINSARNTVDGAMNRCALWTTTYSNNQQIGFSVCFNIPTDKTYLVGFGVDNFTQIRIDGQYIVNMPSQEIAATFDYYHIYPVYLKKGIRVLEIIANNASLIAAIGAEIYDCTPAELMAIDTVAELDSVTVFTTKNMLGDYTNLGTNGYPIDPSYALVLCYGEPPFYRRVLTMDCSEVSVGVEGVFLTAVATSNYIHVSNNRGETFTTKGNAKNWTSVALSYNGKYQVAVSYDNYIYLSNDFGITFSAKGVSTARLCVAINSDGQYQTAPDRFGYIFVSNDYGETWTSKGQSKWWAGVAMNGSGQYQTAVIYGDFIYVSVDYGQTWVTKGISRGYKAVAISDSGQYQVAVGYWYIYVSTDYGETWVQKNTGIDWKTVAISLNGQYITATPTNGQIYVSSDYGETWVLKGFSLAWGAVTMGGTGRYQAAFVASGNYFILSSDYGQTWATKTVSTQAWKAVSMSK